MGSRNRLLLWGTSTVLMAGSLILAGGLNPVLAAADTNNSTQHTVGATTAPSGSTDPAGNIGMQADAIARSNFSNIYGGMMLTEHGSHVNIYLTSLNSSAEKAIMGTVPTSDFTFIKTSHTLNQLLDIEQKIGQNWSTIQSRGIKLEEWGPDIATGKELIGVENLSSSDKSYLASEYGSGNIELQNLSPSQVPVITSRSNDSAPWNGGDFITSTVGNYYIDCSSGFPAHAGSTQYMITAAHCYPSGTYVQNGSRTTSAGSFGNFNTMGYVSSVNSASGGLDAEIIKTSSYGGSSKLVFAGSSSNPTRDAVSGTTTSPVGYQVCGDGAFEGEICGLVIQNSNMCITENLDNGGSRYVCHVVKATNTSGGIANGAGDSGGPVFRFNGSYLEATGIITAGSNPVSCTNYPTSASGAARPCYSTLYYTNINSIDSSLGVALNT